MMTNNGPSYIANGWEFVATLPTKKAMVKLPH